MSLRNVILISTLAHTLAELSMEKQDTIRFPCVSIIVPNLNSMQLLKKCISSLLQTDYPNFEIIVIDNGSKDEDIELFLRRYPEVRVVRLRQNMGVPFAYNLGLSLSSGEFVSFVNNDMEFDPAWLKHLVYTLQSDPSLAGCDSKYLNYFKRNIIDTSGGAGRFIDKYGNAIVRGGGEYDKGQFDKREEVFYGLSLFRKKLIQKVGRFDEKFLHIMRKQTFVGGCTGLVIKLCTFQKARYIT